VLHPLRAPRGREVKKHARSRGGGYLFSENTNPGGNPGNPGENIFEFQDRGNRDTYCSLAVLFFFVETLRSPTISGASFLEMGRKPQGGIASSFFRHLSSGKTLSIIAEISHSRSLANISTLVAHSPINPRCAQSNAKYWFTHKVIGDSHRRAMYVVIDPDRQQVVNDPCGFAE